MLNGIAPIIIFNFNKAIFGLTVVSDVGPTLPTPKWKLPLPPIPVYLDEKLTGIYIESESKTIDIETQANTNPEGDKPEVIQKGLNSIITVNALANSGSIGLSILLALSDLIFQRVTSQEYSITYIHGAMSVFNGLLESFSAEQNSDNSLYRLSFKLSTAPSNSSIAKAATLQVAKSTGELPTT